MDAVPQLSAQDKRTLALSSLGGALEFYDFVIYVFYAKIISDLFFPSTLSPFWAMLNTYGIFAAGYFFVHWVASSWHILAIWLDANDYFHFQFY